MQQLQEPNSCTPNACLEVLFAAGGFFWVVHFPGLALIAFSDISGDMDYFAFVSHLSAKGLQL